MSRGGPGTVRGEVEKTRKKPEKRSGPVYLGYYAATSRILCRRFQSEKWLSIPPFGACRGPPPNSKVVGERGRLNLPSVQHTTQGSADIIPQQRIRLWGLQSVKQRRGDQGFESRVPCTRDVCAIDCRYWIWRPQVKIIYLGEQRGIAAVFSMEHISLRTDRDPSVLAA